MLKQCKHPGCSVKAGRYTGYCAQHAIRTRTCVIDDCKNKVAIWSKSGCCFEHRAEGKKLLP